MYLCKFCVVILNFYLKLSLQSSPRLEPSTPSDSRSSTSTMPKETVKTPEVLGSRSPRGEQLPVTSSLMRQSGSSTTPVIISNPHSPSGHQTSLRSPSKEGGIPHVNEREGENIKDSKQRVCKTNIKHCEICFKSITLK